MLNIGQIIVSGNNIGTVTYFGDVYLDKFTIITLHLESAIGIGTAKKGEGDG